MASQFTDKSLNAEAALGGWALARRREFAEPGVTPRYAPDRSCVLEHITLDLAIDPVARTLVGEALLHTRPLAGAQGPYLFDLDELTVDSVTRPDGTPLRHTHADGRLEVEPADRILVRWHGSPRRGLYFVGPSAEAPERPPEAWTQCQDEDAHFIFPCFDQPGVKHTWRVRIRAPEGYGVLGNGRAVGDHWEVDAPMPAYLFTAVVMKMDVYRTDVDGLPVAWAVPAGTSQEDTERAFGRTGDMVRHLSGLYGAYPWARYDQVVVHDFVFGGMENLGCTTMFDVILLDARAALDNEMQSLVVHELAHQWFGDLLTCQDWSQGWLNEGWATYTECLWIDVAEGADEAVWHAYEQLGNYLGEEGNRYRRPIVSYLFKEPIDVFDRHLYEKGSLVLRTLRAHLGDEAFWAGVRLYLSRHRHQTVHTRHFQRALEDATGRTLDGFFDSWVFRPGHPVVEVALSTGDGLLTVVVRQTQEGTDVPSAYSFGLRVRVGETERVLAVAQRERSFTLPWAEGDPIVVDAGMGVLADLSLKGPRKLLMPILASGPCPVLRTRAARALAADGSPEAVAALARALQNDPFWGVRAEIAGMLGARGALDLLRPARADAHPKVRRAVIAAIGTIRRPEAIACISEIGEDPSILVTGEVVRMLGRLQAPETRARAEALLSQDSWSEILRARALEALGALRDAAVLPTLLAWTESDRPVRARAAAATALARLGDEVESTRTAAIERLIVLVEDPHLRVQLAATNALGTLRDPRGLTVLARAHDSAADGRARRLAWEATANIREGRTGNEALGSLRGEVERLVEENRKLRVRVEKLEPMG